MGESNGLWLGVRCWKSKVAIALIDAAQEPASVVFLRRHPSPPTADVGERAAWFARTVAEAIAETGCSGVAVRIADRNPSQARAEAEGAVLVAVGEARLPSVTLRRQNLMRPLGIKSSKGSWAAYQAHDPVVGALKDEEKDAVMASIAGSRL